MSRIKSNEEVCQFNFFTIFLFFCITFFLLIFINNWFLISNELYYDSLGEQLSFEKINELINFNKKWGWIVYPVTPVLYLLKFLLVVICFFTGSLVLGIEVKTKTFFKIVLIGEFVFLLPIIVKLFWFSIFKTDYNLEDLQYFSPFSALSLFNPKEVEPWLIYPFQLLNVFELLYWFILAYLLKDVINKTFSQSLGFVASTYGVGLFIWIVFVTFLTVSLSA